MFKFSSIRFLFCRAGKKDDKIPLFFSQQAPFDIVSIVRLC